MRYLFFSILCLNILFATITKAQDAVEQKQTDQEIGIQDFVVKNKVAVIAADKCKTLIGLAETKEMSWIYEACGFDDESDAWKNWASFVSQKGYKKAIYQLCQRYPTHEFGALYCQKSAELGYIPALYVVAHQKKQSENYPAYVGKLEKIVGLNDLSGKNFIRTEEEETVLKVLKELGLIYFRGKYVEQDFSRAYGYLDVATNLGSPEAAHALSIILFKEGGQDLLALSEKYCWKAVAQGCPAAEEIIGLLDLLKSGRMKKNDVMEQMDARLDSCKALSVEKEEKTEGAFCDCPSVLSWYKTQVLKPYIITEIDKNKKEATLRNLSGEEETVSLMNLTSSGYLVQEIRPTAVILLKSAERYVLLFQKQESECIDICQNQDPASIQSLKSLQALPVYKVNFTSDMCEKLVNSVELLDDLSKPFRGMRECLLQDWATWGDWALENKNNKLLYLLGHYQKSDYIPSLMSEVERLFDSKNPADRAIVQNALTYISAQTARDKLSILKKEQAFCVRTYTLMQGEEKNDSQAYSWAQMGAQLGYPASMNMLGILYATGTGVEQDLKQAKDWFMKAEDASLGLYLDARHNLRLLDNTDFDKNAFKYGDCREIVNPKIPEIKEIEALYP